MQCRAWSGGRGVEKTTDRGVNEREPDFSTGCVCGKKSGFSLAKNVLFLGQKMENRKRATGAQN